MFGVGRLPAVLYCVMLLDLLDSVVVGLSLCLGLVIWDIVGLAMLSALGLFGFKGLQFHRKLLELVSGIK